MNLVRDGVKLTVKMTGDEICRKLGYRPTGRLTLTVGELKSRLGNWETMNILPKGRPADGRDILVLTYQTDDGEADVVGAQGFINGQDALCDAYVILRPRNAPAIQGPTGAQLRFGW